MTLIFRTTVTDTEDARDEIEDDEACVLILIAGPPKPMVTASGPYPTRAAANAVVEKERARGVFTANDVVYVRPLSPPCW